MNGIVSFRKCTLTNKELIEKADSMTDQMYTDGKIPPRNIPAQPNDDYDLIVGEMIWRFDEMDKAISFFTSVIKSGEAWSDECEEMLNKVRGNL